MSVSFIDNLPSELSFNLFMFLPDRDLCVVGLLNKKYKLLTDEYLSLYRKNSLKIKSAWQDYLIVCQEYKEILEKSKSTLVKKNEVLRKLEKTELSDLEEILFYLNTYTCLSSCSNRFKVCIKLKKVRRLRKKQNKYAAKIKFLDVKKNNAHIKSLRLHRKYCNYKRGENEPYFNDEPHIGQRWNYEDERRERMSMLLHHIKDSPVLQRHLGHY